MANPEGPLANLITHAAQDPPAPHVPQAPQVLQQPIPHMLPLNWSQFKPEFSRKPDEDAEVHLLKTNDWIYTGFFSQ